MRKSSVFLVLVALLMGPLSASEAGAAVKRRADLVAKGPSATYAAGRVAVTVTIKNKGTKRAKRTVTGFVLSTDGTRSSNDAVLGTKLTLKLRPKAKRTVSATFPLPVGLKPGAYRLIACADDTHKVRERKEQNNCKASRTTVTLPAGPPPRQVTISWTIAPVDVTIVGKATGQATNGTCTDDLVTGGGTCTVDAGVGTVTLTATPLVLPVFQGWSGPGCTSTANPLVLTAPQTDVACTATFALS